MNNITFTILKMVVSIAAALVTLGVYGVIGFLI